MKKAIQINISGIIFHIDEDAYEILQKYLTALTDYFTKRNESTEIIDDIEARIAELFQSKVSDQKQSISIQDVEDVIKTMGEPEDFLELDDETTENDEGAKSSKKSKSYARWENRRFYRDPDNAILGGVCSGLGAYFNIDPIIFRIIFVVALFIYGIVGLVYILLWIIAPTAKTPAQKLEMRGESVNVTNIEKIIREEYDSVKSNFQKFRKSEQYEKTKDTISDIFRLVGVLIIGIAKVFLLLLGLAFIIGGFAILLGFAGIFIFRTTFIPGIFDHISTSWLTFTSYLLPQTDINALIALTLIIVGIPIVAIIYGGMKLVFRFKANDKIFGAFIFVFWLISAGVLTSMVLIEGRGFAHYGVEREEFTLFSTAPDTLYLRVNSEKMLEIRETSDYVEIRNFGIYFNPDMNVFYGKPELNFYESDRNEIKMTLLREARGNSSREARKSAEGILYSWEIDGTTLTLDPCFSALEDTPWKAQHAEITISLPAEVIIAIDDELAELLDNRYFSHFWSYHDKVINTGNYWYVKGSSIKPLNQ